MALTQEQKERIVEYIGWPVKTVKEDSIFYNNYLNLKWLGNLSTETEARVATYLSRIGKIETQKEEAIERLAAEGFGNEMQLNSQEINQLDSLKSKYSRELRVMLGIPVYRGN